MFRIDSTGSIQINKGDTAETVFYVNLGPSKLYDYIYSFKGSVKVRLSENIKTYDVELYEDIWINKVFLPGKYEFIWDKSYLCWNLNEEEVNLSEYGIFLQHVITTAIPDEATITVQYDLCNSESELYFYIWQPLQQVGDVPVLKKTIQPYSNTVITEFEGEELYTENRNCVDIFGNPVLHFNPEDTIYIPAGEYRYQVIAKLYMNGEYITNTVCNRTPFMVVDDDYSDRIWYRP